MIRRPPEECQKSRRNGWPERPPVSRRRTDRTGRTAEPDPNRRAGPARRSGPWPQRRRAPALRRRPRIRPSCRGRTAWRSLRCPRRGVAVTCRAARRAARNGCWLDQERAFGRCWRVCRRLRETCRSSCRMYGHLASRKRSCGSGSPRPSSSPRVARACPPRRCWPTPRVESAASARVCTTAYQYWSSRR